MHDIDLKLAEVTVLGKGRRIRRVSMGVKTTRAVDRYLRMRRTHEWASTTECAWLGLKGVLTENGIRQMLERRATQAGLGHLNLHRLRHTWAHHMKLSACPIWISRTREDGVRRRCLPGTAPARLGNVRERPTGAIPSATRCRGLHRPAIAPAETPATGARPRPGQPGGQQPKNGE